MINSKSVSDIVQLSITERLRIIEIIFQSLKNDLQREQKKAEGHLKEKPFKVRKFHLGRDVCIDRDELYADRI
jgi:hypothetical protein